MRRSAPIATSSRGSRADRRHRGGLCVGVCEFLDLPFDQQMLRYYERAGDIVSTTAVPDRHKDMSIPRPRA